MTIALDQIGIAALHPLVCLMPRSTSVTGKLALIKPVAGYALLSSVTYYNLTATLPYWLFGVLRHYDLPDLMAVVAPQPLMVFTPVDATLAPLTQQQVGPIYDFAARAYERAGASDAFRVLADVADDSILQQVLRWLQ